MSNTLVTSSISIKDTKSDYLELIAKGYNEQLALDTIGLPRHLYLKWMMEDSEFVKEIEEARKQRAEIWITKIAKSVDEDVPKDEIPSERLKFDKLMFLAKADNPDRYGGNKKNAEININLGQFKLLPPEQAMEALKNDPFAIETTATVITEQPEDLL